MVLSWGQKVKRLRLSRGWSQRELARRADMGDSTIPNIEAEIRPQPRPDTIRRLAAAFGVPNEYFLTDDPREYARIRAATVTGAEAGSLVSPEARLEWLLADMEEKWGEEYGISGVANYLGIEPQFLRDCLAGRVELSSYLLEAVSERLGLPSIWFMTGDVGAGLPKLNERYEEILLLAQAAGLDPSLLKRQVELLVEMNKRGG